MNFRCKSGHDRIRVSKFILLFILCCNLITVKVSAQFYKEQYFPSYSYYLLKVMDISWKQPKDFIWEKTGKTEWSQRPWGQIEDGSVYIGTMYSKDGNCLILYPECGRYMMSSLQNPSHSEDPAFAHKHMIYDLNDAFEKEFPLDSIPPELERYVTILVGRKTPFNADTVFIAEIPLKDTYRERYKHCTGIYATKQGRPAMLFKCFFTDEGKSNEEKYLAKFYKTIKYRRNKKWVYDTEISIRTLYEIYKNSIIE